MSDYYEYTDEVILYMRKRFVRMFSDYKSQLHIDELNVLRGSKALYEDLFDLTVDCFVRIARNAYKKYNKKDVKKIDRDWVLDYLTEYDPITKYVFTHEVERKQGRFAESVIASSTPMKEIDTALRYWSSMVNQYSIEVTDKAALQAMIDTGIKKVIWIAQDDEKTCKKCESRNGKVYTINNVPPKEHIGCRCYLKPYKE